jgi:hypothetical protein
VPLLPRQKGGLARSGLSAQRSRVSRQASAVPGRAEHPEPPLLGAAMEEGEQKGGGQRRKPQHFCPRVSFADARTVEGQLALLLGPTQFDLPASQRGKDQAAALLIGVDGFGREEVQGERP